MSDETPQNPEEPTVDDTSAEVLEGNLMHDKVEQIDLQDEMKRSYLDYAMAVIVGRALPDVRDGL